MPRQLIYILLIFVIFVLCKQKQGSPCRSRETFTTRDLSFVFPMVWPVLPNPYKDPPTNSIIDRKIQESNAAFKKRYLDVAFVLDDMMKEIHAKINVKQNTAAIVDYLQRCSKERSLSETKTFWSADYQDILLRVTTAMCFVMDTLPRGIRDYMMAWAADLRTKNMNMNDTWKSNLWNENESKGNAELCRVRNVINLAWFTKDYNLIIQLNNSVNKWMKLSVGKQDVYIADGLRGSRAFSYTASALVHLRYILLICLGIMGGLGKSSEIHKVKESIELYNRFVDTWNKDRKNNAALYSQFFGIQQKPIPKQTFFNKIDIGKANKLKEHQALLGLDYF
ncbi:hypothetical protein EBZ39_04130 [bacterium]|nr:hypothetical protein [bacterium]